MGAQFTNDEINAAIARMMREDHFRPAPDYLNDPVAEQRFLAATEPIVEGMGEDAMEHYELLQLGCSGKVVAMVALLRLMDS